MIIRGFVFFRLVRNGDSPQKMAVENSCRNLNIVKSVGEWKHTRIHMQEETETHVL